MRKFRSVDLFSVECCWAGPASLSELSDYPGRRPPTATGQVTFAGPWASDPGGFDVSTWDDWDVLASVCVGFAGRRGHVGREGSAR